jgi:hypothetical protein
MLLENNQCISRKSTGNHQEETKIEKTPQALASGIGRQATASALPLLQSIAKEKTQGTMKNRRKTLHELPAYIAQKVTERRRGRPTSKLLYASTGVRTQ